MLQSLLIQIGNTNRYASQEVCIPHVPASIFVHASNAYNASHDPISIPIALFWMQHNWHQPSEALSNISTNTSLCIAAALYTAKFRVSIMDYIGYDTFKITLYSKLVLKNPRRKDARILLGILFKVVLFRGQIACCARSQAFINDFPQVSLAIFYHFSAVAYAKKNFFSPFPSQTNK